jgi:uncharacterized protein (DUF779 family)
MLQQTAKDVHEIAYALLSVTWALQLVQTMWNPRISYPTQHSDPWLMFNFCVISAIVTLLSPENHGSGFVHFLITGWCCDASSALCNLSWTFLSIYIHSCEKETCPHTEHIHVWISAPSTTYAHNNIPCISVLPWWTMYAMQPCSVSSTNSYADSKIKITGVLTCQTTSYSIANSRRCNSYQWPQGKLRKLSEDPSCFQHDGK